MLTPRKTIATAAIVCASLLGLASPAVAAPQAAPATTAEVISVSARTGSSTAKIAVKYTCTGAPEQLHVWVSLKQSADRKADPKLAEEGTGYGGVAAAWSQTHVGALKCDGKSHLGVFTVDQKEAGYGTLKRGWAYVQFCLFDANYQQAPFSDFEFGYLL